MADPTVRNVDILPPYIRKRKVKSRNQHTCYLCGSKIEKGEEYYRYIEPSTGFERKACSRHVDDGWDREWRRRVEEWRARAERECILIETDAAGPNGERWAFVAFHIKPEGEEELHRERGPTPAEYATGPTPGEGFAIVKALEWHRKAEQDGKIPVLPVVITNDNYAVVTKLQTRVTRGRYDDLWERLIELSDPYVEEGRFFAEMRFAGHGNEAADLYV